VGTDGEERHLKVGNIEHIAEFHGATGETEPDMAHPKDGDLGIIRHNNVTVGRG
jgi:hypothetical protein